MQRASPCESSTRSPKATTMVGSARPNDAGRLEQRIADEEIAIAGHEADRPIGGGGGEHLGAARFEAALGHVVADPDLEQVAEDEHGVGVGVAQMRRPGLEHARRVLGQVQVREQVDRAPVRRRDEGRERLGLRQRRCARRRRCHGAGRSARPPRRQETTVARVIVTSSSGTSAWPPRLPVRTFSIASTTSWPDDDAPKTA